jgi:hypothetical protein
MLLEIKELMFLFHSGDLKSLLTLTKLLVKAIVRLIRNGSLWKNSEELSFQELDVLALKL